MCFWCIKAFFDEKFYEVFVQFLGIIYHLLSCQTQVAVGLWGTNVLSKNKGSTSLVSVWKEAEVSCGIPGSGAVSLVLVWAFSTAEFSMAVVKWGWCGEGRVRRVSWDVSALHLCPHPSITKGIKLCAASSWSVQSALKVMGVPAWCWRGLVLRTTVGKVELWLHTHVPGLCTPAAANVGTCGNGSSSILEQVQWDVVIFRSWSNFLIILVLIQQGIIKS